MWRIEIEGWHPTTLNRLLANHWAVRNRLKQADAQMIGAYALMAGVPKAASKRSVAIRVEGWPRGRIPDHDAYLKSTLDALVACQAIKDDSPTWCEWSVEHMRAPKKKTLIIITETKTEES